ncbi:hypothetical protein [Parablautia muri]|uniref:hypothetical protein n=1 Tax=Parablautia muri TaxID=2320879 RepID=UPI001368FBCE|nr:hypothetical protein [Parablautia muri]
MNEFMKILFPVEAESGNGYALLSAPAKYNYLSVKSGEYTMAAASQSSSMIPRI